MAENIQRQHIPTTYFIKRVKDISFYVDERSYIADPLKVIKIELNKFLGVNIEKNIVDFTLKIFIHYEETPENILADIHVQNIFEVENLKSFSNTDGLFLPNELIIAMISMAISHGRALFAKNLAGTVYQDVVLPITNPILVAKHFFPNMFQDEAKVKNEVTEEDAEKRTEFLPNR